jgi:hypothetical protein
MIKQGINYLTYFALFLPFSCNERRQLGTIQCKAESLELVEKMMKTAPYGYFAKACKSLQSEPSQGSGPGGRWFESTRPDQFYFQ